MDQEIEAVKAEVEVEEDDHLSSKESEDGKKQEHDPVPYDRFARQNAKLAEALGKLNTLLESPPERKKEAEKTYSATELRSLVASGELSTEAADEIKERQLRKSITEEVTGAVRQSSQATQLRTELDAYEKAVPGLADNTTDEYARVEQEYRYLINNVGQAEGPGTMVAAARAVFGPLAALKSTAKVETKREVFEEGGSGSGDATGGADKEKPKLTQRQKDYYRPKIEQGLYKNWDEVIAEVSFKRPDNPWQT